MSLHRICSSYYYQMRISRSKPGINFSTFSPTEMASRAQPNHFSILQFIPLSFEQVQKTRPHPTNRLHCNLNTPAHYGLTTSLPLADNLPSAPPSHQPPEPEKAPVHRSELIWPLIEATKTAFDCLDCDPWHFSPTPANILSTRGIPL